MAMSPEGPPSRSRIATYRSHIRETQDKAYCVQDVGLAGAIQTSNCVEGGIPTSNLCAYWVRLEAYGRDVLRQS